MAPRLTSVERESQDNGRQLSNKGLSLIFTPMNFPHRSSVVGKLTTIGRKSGQPRTVELRFICYHGAFYASSSRIFGKHWCQNIVKNPAVELSVNGQRMSCVATQVADDQLRRQILTFRSSPPELNRVVFEIGPRG